MVSRNRRLEKALGPNHPDFATALNSLSGLHRARRAMMALIDDQSRPHYAHPLFWAPFVVVGEGGVINR